MRIMFYSEDKTEGLSLEHSISDNSAESACKEAREEQDRQEFLQQRPGSQNL